MGATRENDRVGDDGRCTGGREGITEFGKIVDVGTTGSTLDVRERGRKI